VITDREGWLAETLVDLVDTPAAGLDEAAYAYGLALRLAELLGPAEVGVLLCAGAGRAAVSAGSSERAAKLAFLEAGGAAGPASEIRRNGGEVRDQACAAAAVRARWPQFADATLAAGFTMVTALPMNCHGETVGAIVLFGGAADEVSSADVGLAGLLAEVAAIMVAKQRELARTVATAGQLQHALDSRVVIEQAKGATAAWLGITTGAAFELLRGYSRHTGRALTEVARDVIRGAVPVADLTASASARHESKHPRPAR
jgi:hypothetical protein